VDPPEQTVYLSAGAFTADVAIADVTDLGSFQFTLVFSPTVMHVDGVALGDFLGSTGRNTSPVGPQIDNETGTLTFGGFSFGEPPGPNGSGLLATITFSPQAEGESALHLQSVQVTNTVPEEIAVGQQDGQVTVLQTIPGDLDGDCDVDVMDIMIVASHWNSSEGDPDYDARYDMDGDGDIDIVDIMRVVIHWGESCPPPVADLGVTLAR
jgi:hypothetical protein